MCHCTWRFDVLERFFRCVTAERDAIHVPPFVTRSLQKEEEEAEEEPSYKRQNKWKFILP
jgi:hypothetical protein